MYGNVTKRWASSTPAGANIGCRPSGTSQPSEQADRSPEQQQRRADDDRRDRDGQVDEDAERPLAAEAVARQHVRGVRAEDGVDRGRRERDEQAEAQRELRLGRGEDLDEVGGAAAEGEDEDGRERHEDQRQQDEQHDPDRERGAPPRRRPPRRRTATGTAALIAEPPAS